APSGHAGEVHRLLEQGQLDAARAMLAADRGLKDTRDDMQQTPLRIAAHRGHVEIVRLLLEQGADVNPRAYNRLPCLHLADDPPIVRLVIRHKADLEAVSVSGTALQTAASRCNHREHPVCQRWLTVVKLLLAAGARYDILSAAYLGDT